MSRQVRGVGDDLERGLQLLLDVGLAESLAHKDLLVTDVLGADRARVRLAPPAGPLVGLEAGQVGRGLRMRTAFPPASALVLEVGRTAALELNDVGGETVHPVGEVGAEVQGEGLGDEAVVVRVVLAVVVVVVRVAVVGSALVPLGGHVDLEQALSGDFAIRTVGYIAPEEVKKNIRVSLCSGRNKHDCHAID